MADKTRKSTRSKVESSKTKKTVAAKSKASSTKKKSTKKNETQTPEKVRVVNRISAPKSTSGDKKLQSKGLRGPQYSYMKAPGLAHDFQVGDVVEVFCDHEKDQERVRGWIAGIVVQVDNKMVAVQFRSNVFLTDGWMVPDRILWYPLNSEHIRATASGRKSAKSTKKEKVIPDY